MDLGLSHKTALVTGGSHGIGLAIALALAREGVGVHIAARGQHDLVKAVSQFRNLEGKVWAHKFDALVPEQVDGLAQEILKGGGVDILINNVGGMGRSGSSYFEFTEDQIWDNCYRKNTGVAIQLMKLLLPSMVAKQWGRVVCISSIHGVEGGGRPWFAAAKSAQVAIMKAFAKDRRLARANITFNSICPGSLMIPDTSWAVEANTRPEEYVRFTESLPLGRLGAPEEVADLAAFLCSPRASYINGSCTVADGGEGFSF